MDDKILNEIVKLVQGMEKGDQLLKQAGIVNDTPGAGVVSEKQMENFFDIVWSGPNRLQKTAMVLTEPLKERIDYWGVSRKVLMPWEIGIGDIPYADKDIKEFASVVSGGFGPMPIVETKVRRVIFPTFELKRAYPVPYAETFIRRYSVFDRAKERVAIANAIAEDNETFKVVDIASHVGVNAWIAGGATLAKGDITQALGVLESNQLIGATMLMHPTRFSDMRNFGSADLDPVTLNTLNETGKLAKYMGLNIITSAKADPNAVYILTTPDKLGRMPIRKAVEVKIMDHTLRSTYYVCSYAIEGFGIHNSYGVVRIEFAGRTKGNLGQVYFKNPVAQIPL